MWRLESQPGRVDNRVMSAHQSGASQQSEHIVVGMSGGVDSSVAAMLLQQQGYQVTGLFMKNWEEDDDGDYCAAAVDLADAQAVCDQLNIPLHTVNFAHEYWERVFSHFLNEYQAGRTPNPDVLCNREIKFKEFLKQAKTLGADAIATGHYAGVRYYKNRYQLLRGVDANKDQSYFLYMLGQAVLSKTLFPLTALTKPEIRKLASDSALPVHDKKDSTGICFIGERRFKDFLSQYIKPNPGVIKSVDNEAIGKHDGLMYHTIGQRQGLGIGGAGEPWYVVGKEIENNVLRVAQGHDHPALMCNQLTAEQLHWVSGDAPALPLRCSAKTRYRQGDETCEVSVIESSQINVEFDQPQRAITPGQSVVFYQNQVCLGGGIII